MRMLKCTRVADIKGTEARGMFTVGKCYRVIIENDFFGLELYGVQDDNGNPNLVPLDGNVFGFVDADGEFEAKMKEFEVVSIYEAIKRKHPLVIVDNTGEMKSQIDETLKSLEEYKKRPELKELVSAIDKITQEKPLRLRDVLLVFNWLFTEYELADMFEHKCKLYEKI